MTENLVIRDLSVSFFLPEGKRQVVNQIDLTCKKGAITGLIGESGSGKSVVGMSILRLLPPNAMITGTIHFKGLSILEAEESSVYALRGNEIGFIPQNPSTSFDPMKRVGSQILEVLQVQYKNKTGQELDKKAGQERLLEKLSHVGFEDPYRVSRAYSFELSGGMNQRALCALATISNPSWLIADEPTKGLDTILRKQLFMYFKSLKEEGMSILLITHDLELAEHLCDDIGVMRSGDLVEFGHATDIINNPQTAYTKQLMAARPSALLKRGGL